ncbi:MAG TPA: hypothetical protein VIH88_02550 [Candidatus Acidoferrales bacterium]
MIATDKVALIVGAGFSTEANLPTTSEMGERFLQTPPKPILPGSVEDEINRQLQKFWESTFGYKHGRPHPSLEDHFTLIDLAANSGHHIGPAYSPKKLGAIRRFSIHRAFQILDSSYEESDTIHQLLRALQRRRRSPIVCVNWDIVGEKHLRRIRANYDYGPVVQQLDPIPESEVAVPFLKLHGSTNWTYCDSCRTLFAAALEEGKDALNRLVFIEADDFRFLDTADRVIAAAEKLPARRRCPNCDCQLTARVGTFSFRNDFAIQQFQTIWQTAHRELRESAAWLFIGYSMPESGFEFRNLLKSAQMAGTLTDRRQIQIVLRGDCDAALRYKRFFGLGDQQINQNGMSFWVTNCMDAWLSSLPHAR